MVNTKKNHYLMRDNIAKKIFKDEVLGRGLTARLLGEILHEDYKTIYENLTPKFTEIGINTNTVNNEADIVYNTNENVINIEINYLYGPARNAQMNSYLCNLYLGQIKTYKDYENTKGIIQILIEDYDYFKQGEYVYEVVLKDKKTNIEDDGFFKRFRISLDYLNSMNYNQVIKSDNKLVKLLYFLVCQNKMEKKKVYEDDKFMEKVIKNAEEIAGRENMSLYLSNDEITKLDQEYHRRMGRKAAIEEMIINMYTKEIPINIIAECANLTVNEVQNILTKHNEKNKSK